MRATMKLIEITHISALINNSALIANLVNLGAPAAILPPAFSNPIFVVREALEAVPSVTIKHETSLFRKINGHCRSYVSYKGQQPPACLIQTLEDLKARGIIVGYETGTRGEYFPYM